jgi:hypothetical protein
MARSSANLFSNNLSSASRTFSFSSGTTDVTSETEGLLIFQKKMSEDTLLYAGLIVL